MTRYKIARIAMVRIGALNTRKKLPAVRIMKANGCEPNHKKNQLVLVKMKKKNLTNL